MKRRFLGCVALLSLWSAPPTGAAIILSDSFDYTNGPLVTVSDGTWGTHSGTTGQVQVLSGKVLLAYTNSEDVSVQLGQSYPATSAIALFASFTVNFTRFPAGAGDFFAHFKAGGTSGFRDKIYATTNGVPTGFFRVGVANTNNDVPTVILTNNLSLNTDYTLLTRYVLSNATSTLWLNPAAESDPGVTAADVSTASAESAFALREGDHIGILCFDNLIIGTNFSDVLPNLPPTIAIPPQSQTVTEGSNVTFMVTASGTTPLSYQWQFNGTNQDGATTSFHLAGVTTNQAGEYTVTVTNAFGSTNSAAATLIVNRAHFPPVITTNPASQTVVEGADVAFTVAADGAQPKLSVAVQWNQPRRRDRHAAVAHQCDCGADRHLPSRCNQRGRFDEQPARHADGQRAAARRRRAFHPHLQRAGQRCENWSTNSLQVQAIGRQVQFLQPDIITFQEIPMSLAYEMTNFVAAYLPGYFLATSPTADGFTRSSIASRFPIARATSWLRQADLAPFGYTNSNFSRDLYEAQLTVPGFEQPLHVFTVHLKSGSSSDELAQAQCRGLRRFQLLRHRLSHH